MHIRHAYESNFTLKLKTNTDSVERHATPHRSSGGGSDTVQLATRTPKMKTEFKLTLKRTHNIDRTIRTRTRAHTHTHTHNPVSKPSPNRARFIAVNIGLAQVSIFHTQQNMHLNANHQLRSQPVNRLLHLTKRFMPTAQQALPVIFPLSPFLCWPGGGVFRCSSHASLAHMSEFVQASLPSIHPLV